jgi:chloramphenicol 3-O phosphotransferase
MSGIIFLHGASSSGKSTIARALQAKLRQPFLHYSIDHLRNSGVLPSGRISAGDFAWRDMRRSFFDGFHRSVAAFADAGNDLIVEHILDTPGWHDQLAGLLAPNDMLFVAVHTPLGELRRREAARADRPAGSAEADFHAVHRRLKYDLEVRGDADADMNADAIVTAWSQRPIRSAFFVVSK